MFAVFSGDADRDLFNPLLRLRCLEVRSLFVIDAPVSRVEAVLSRNKTIRDIVRNDWVRFLVRDPATGQLFRQVPRGARAGLAESRDLNALFMRTLPEAQASSQIQNS